MHRPVGGCEQISNEIYKITKKMSQRIIAICFYLFWYAVNGYGMEGTVIWVARMIHYRSRCHNHSHYSIDHIYCFPRFHSDCLFDSAVRRIFVPVFLDLP